TAFGCRWNRWASLESPEAGHRRPSALRATGVPDALEPQRHGLRDGSAQPSDATDMIVGRTYLHRSMRWRRKASAESPGSQLAVRNTASAAPIAAHDCDGQGAVRWRQRYAHEDERREVGSGDQH